jgi:hypothetical protein
MKSFIRIKLVDTGCFAKMETCEGDDVADLVSRAVVRFPSWKMVDSSQLSLYLVAAGGDEEPSEKDISTMMLSGDRLGVGHSLLRAGIESGAWLVAAPQPAATSSSTPSKKSFILLVNSEDEYGEVVPKSLDVTLTTQGELEKLAKRHGGGSLVLDNTAAATIKMEELVNGGTYTLIGGQQEAVKRHSTWTQQSDKMLEEAATKAVHNACEKTLGTLDMRLDTTLKNRAGETRQLDGLLINTNTAIVVEAKHAAASKHVELVLDKASFFLQYAREGHEKNNLGNLEGITNVIPVLASSRFGPTMISLCKAKGVGIVKPNGSGYSYTPFSSSASHPIGRTRGFHTLARVLRVLF